MPFANNLTMTFYCTVCTWKGEKAKSTENLECKVGTS